MQSSASSTIYFDDNLSSPDKPRTHINHRPPMLVPNTDVLDISCSTQNISTNNVISDHMEFDFELCHMQYGYCCCWRRYT